jgi:hypothetical protein
LAERSKCAALFESLLIVLVRELDFSRAGARLSNVASVNKSCRDQSGISGCPDRHIEDEDEDEDEFEFD